MTAQPHDPALSLRAALQAARRDDPRHFRVSTRRLTDEEVGADFAAEFAGIPATSRSHSEDVVLYTDVNDGTMPVVLGLYGDADRVRGWLPGLPTVADRAAADALVAAARAPEFVRDQPACQAEVLVADGRVRGAVNGRGSGRLGADAVDLAALPVLRTTPRDAGRYLTMGMVCAHDPDRDGYAVSVHRMLVLDHNRLTLWTLPSRRLRELCAAAAGRGERLPVSINIGVPPAAMIASALNSRFLPAGVDKLDVAGALAGAPIALATAVSQPVTVLAESEIVLEGYLDGATADESVVGPPTTSLPEFLGYDGSARPDLPVVTVTAITTRRRPVYQATIGPGREQSVILGLAGALSLALSGGDDYRDLVRDAHFSAAGGGLLLLTMSVRKGSPRADQRLAPLARKVFADHPFVKLIVFTDEDIDISSAEDVLWAMTTRANLATDCLSFAGFPHMAMDPSQSLAWAAAKGTGGEIVRRVAIDATVPHRLRESVVRSFPVPVRAHR
ncbi:4-hydroxy-3-polyprenylbenzoate decarboxylase [Saccharothrix ecbatanensis]|uniref:4-hydroxy-3-polyprenylbenzoate decarboxylase n=1 Tax=Saccharothrix ecbatanensis TaxID=1105145 RepID=A0A7W9HH62_9PSEU|nr:UbiD family decarboxylase [Saccharothrix ecbatanensis]MBB5802217.1 4-hydroxy-3-polyprenylbenzoate decarboxylase [Saccharothrix ecbatanensis]